MNGYLAREWYLWNQVQRGYARFTNDAASASVPAPSSSESFESDDEYDTEKQLLLAQESHPKPSTRRSPSSFVKYILLFQLIAGIIGLCSMSRREDHFVSSSAPARPFSGMSTNSSKPIVPIHEIIEIPVLPALEYGKPVFQQGLLNASFGNSWGHPAIVNYNAPPEGTNFTQVVLTLDLWVDGVQFDRLLHLYLKGNEIWRSSTPEPAGKLTHTFTQKDVSVYDRLFRQDSELMLQLDNLLTPRLTGVVNISLNAFYYYNEKNASLIPHKHLGETDLSYLFTKERSSGADLRIRDVDDVVIPGAADVIFGRSEGADHVIPLVKAPAERPPLVYYPDSDFSVVVPKLAKNTTHTKLLVYTSGNAEEEFWFSNLLDLYKDRFKNHGHVFGGHGPCRVINLYNDGVRIGSANPFPVIYTGGLSPALWNPIVSTGAYDIRAVEFDISSLLPLLWKDALKLKIEVSNCLDDDLKIGEEPSGIGSNWISSANLVVWEGKDVASASGEVLSIDNSTKVTSFAFEPPFAGLLNQIVNAKYATQIRTYFNYTLTNGSSVDFIAEHYTKSQQSSIILIKKFGDNQSVISVPQGKTSVAILDPVDNSTTFNFNVSNSFPLVSGLGTKPIVGPETDYQVNISKKANFKVRVNGAKILQLKATENGTSNFTLSPSGNHGEGRVEHNFTVSNIHGHVYNRHALGDNGTIVYDNTTIINAPGSKSLDELSVAPRLNSVSQLRDLSEEIYQALLDEDPDFAEADLEAYQLFLEMAKEMVENPEDQVDTESENSRGFAKLFTSVLFDW
ncbi:DEKNAAC101721 [Brettanomyces naardenensis]|uniref:DEKNAAC101721 n=1 Tax=Brettanomyces naardenensis TaxID=13370 RepID=A0A448YIP9_BRENA|nr:DEKNAAC101721 [Brettanomyces naardenensis]